MRVFLLNLILAISWSALTGNATLTNFCFGYFVGYLALRVSPKIPEGTKYFQRLPRLIRLGSFFLQELVLSSLRAVLEVFSPKLQSRPQVVRLPLEITDQTQIFILANLISLTPGTVVLEITPDNSGFLVHTMFVDDPDIFREEIHLGFEKRVREAFS
ncbi:Na+/H+ antiporter subunit E [Microbulbifer sp. JMSA002]|uniref:Na+/H+ antiporter subunit E n=1 Tax=Microbulbifer sp. JMSA002 TaxID=3243368 RepID=UPI00403904DA